MIKGDATYLRAVEPEDLEKLYSWENNNENWLISNTCIPFSKNTLKLYLESIHDIYTDKQLRLVICTKSNEEIGLVDLFDFNPQHLRAGIGILIADKTKRNSGFAKDALKAVIKYSFEVLNLHQIHCSILENNPLSIKLFQGLGFEKCGEKKNWVRDGDGYLNEYIYQLINEDS